MPQAMPPLLVLVVDDEVLIHDLVAEALTDAGYGVEYAADGNIALELLNGPHSFRAIVTDIDLGRGPTGWDVARRARETKADFPVVYMSGGSAGDWGARGVPGSTMIAKPFVSAQVVTAVSALLNDESYRFG
ncbi:MAG: response regulator receiver domain protein [Chloroflexi bacterium]|nr:response regulator receiver domain protein [Chloroflexota bacterium]